MTGSFIEITLFLIVLILLGIVFQYYAYKFWKNRFFEKNSSDGPQDLQKFNIYFVLAFVLAPIIFESLTSRLQHTWLHNFIIPLCVVMLGIGVTYGGRYRYLDKPLYRKIQTTIGLLILAGGIVAIIITILLKSGYLH